MPDYSNDDTFVVIDLGSLNTKAGFSDSLGLPECVIPTAIGENADFIERGQIKNWEPLLLLLEDILYSRLKILPEQECPVLIAEPINISRGDREKLSQLIFEEFNIPGLYMCEQSLLSLYAFGKMSGLVVDIGHGTTEIVPIIEGAILRHAAQSVPFAGQDLDEEFLKLLHLDSSIVSQLRSLNIPLNISTARCIKEQCAEARTSTSVDENATVIFPSGQSVSVGSVRFEAAELLFDTASRGFSFPNLVDACRSAIYCCDADKRRILLDQIVLTGGTSLMKGLRERFVEEFNRFLPVSDLVNEGTAPSVHILSPADYMLSFKTHPEWSSWVGGSIVGKINFAQQQHVTKADYNEHGPAIVHVKLN